MDGILEIISFKASFKKESSVRDLLQNESKKAWAEVFPANRFDCTPPLNFADNPDADLFVNSPIPHLYELEHGSAPVELAVMSSVTLATPHGFIFDAEKRLISESFHDGDMVEIPLREVQTMLSDGLLERTPTQRIDSPAMLMMGPWSWVYHHWMLEDLLRLWALDEFPELADMQIVVPGDLTTFQQASLTALGVEKERLLPFDGSNWLFSTLYVPSFLAPGGHSQRQMTWLREKLFSAFDITPNETGHRRLYVSRGDAGTRNITNEPEVIATLEAQGFEVVLPGTLALAEQLALFNDAAVICGTSGSGMTNHVFAPKTATIVEIQPDSYINRAHWFSSNVCGQNYVFLFGPAESDRHDYYLPLGKLEAALTYLTPA
jgi:capsular polysaccharide biosynthesis protein